MSAQSVRVSALVVLSPPFTACHRKVHAELQEIDTIDRRSNLPMVGPVSRDLEDIRRGGTLVVLALTTRLHTSFIVVSRSVMSTNCCNRSRNRKGWN